MKTVLPWSVEYEINTANGCESTCTVVMASDEREAREIVENYHIDDECNVVHVEKE